MTKEEFVAAYNIGHRDGKNDEYLPLCYPEFIESMKQEPCEDAISRQAVLEIIRKCNCQGWVKVDIGEPIEALQPVNPAEKVGRWEWVQYDGNPKIGNYHCSACLCIVEDGKPSYKYCPQCGAKMEGSD